MSLNESTWAEVTDWFDRLIALDPAARKSRLDHADLDREVRRWLDQMLAAHDSPETLLIDRTIDAVAAELAGSESFNLPDDWVGQQIGQWRTVAEIQRGGMATVLLAERDDGQYERQVAIKVLHSDQISRAHQASLQREIQLLAGLSAGVSDPGIVHLIDGGISEQGWPYLVMEYVDGKPIGQWCDHHRSTLEHRIDLLRQVARALAHAHRQLIVHADVKPSNVLVDQNGRARLVDFGIGRLLEADSARDTPAALRCSPAWAAPEQLRGEPASVASDVYGLGMLMYRLLTGQRPREGRQITRLLTGHVEDHTIRRRPSERPDICIRPQALRGDLDAICSKALADDAQQRYSSAEAFERDLAAWQQQRPVEARGGGIRYRFGKWLRRHRLPATAAALTVLALISGSGLALWQAERAQDEAVRATLQAERAETIKDFLLSMFKAADPLRTGGAELDTRTVLQAGADQLLLRDDLDDVVRIDLLTTLADVQTALGWHEDAERFLDQALQLAQSDSTTDPLQHTRIVYEQASLAAERGRFDQAIDHYQQALEMLPAARSESLLELQAWIHIGHGSVLARQNRTEAVLAFEQAEAIMAKLAGPNLEQQSTLLSARAVAAYNAGELESAYDHMQRNFELQLELGNVNQASMIRTLVNLSTVAAQLNRLNEALRHDRNAVEIARRVYEPGHTEIGRALAAQGDTLRQLGRFEQARSVLDEARAIQLDAGMDSEVALLDLALARVLLAQGRGPDALNAAVRARTSLERLQHPTSRAVIRTLEIELAAARLAADHEHTAATSTIAATRLASMPAPDTWQPLPQLLRWRLGELAVTLGDFDHARRWLESANRAPDDVAQHPSVRLRLGALALLLSVTNPAGAAADTIAQQMINVQSLMTIESSNAEAQAYAWCALARAHAALDNLEALDSARAQLQQLAENTPLSAELQRDAGCAEARTD